MVFLKIVVLSKMLFYLKRLNGYHIVFFVVAQN